MIDNMPTRAKYNWSDNTILIVEDTETCTRYFKAALSKTKAKVLWALNGEEAVNLIASDNRVDLILMDIRMPGMNGYRATREIKQIRKDIPVIMQSAYVLSDEAQKSIEAGAEEFLSKPIKLSILLDTCNKYLVKN